MVLPASGDGIVKPPIDRAIEVPGFHVPQSMMFGYPSRLMDTWVPSIECLSMTGFSVPASLTSLSVKAGESEMPCDHRGIKGWRARARAGIKKRFCRRIRTIELEEQVTYDARYVYQGNVAHIIQHVLPHLLLAAEVMEEEWGEAKPIAVVLPKNPLLIARQVYDCLKIPTVITDGAVRGQMLTIKADEFAGLLPLVGRVPIKDFDETTPRRVFISRRDSRTLVNEGEVTEFLASKGYEHFYFEDIPLGQQWSIMRNATDIVAIHGAALGALAFKGVQPGDCEATESWFRLTELFGAGFIVDCFRRYCGVLGGSWVGVRGRITPQIIRDIDFKGKNMRHAFDPFMVDLGCLERALEYHETEP